MVDFCDSKVVMAWVNGSDWMRNGCFYVDFRPTGSGIACAEWPSREKLDVKYTATKPRMNMLCIETLTAESFSVTRHS